MKKCLIGLLLAVLIVVCPVISYADPGQITVSGEGTVSITPDIAYVTLGVNVEAIAAKDAQAKNSKLMSQVITALSNLGIDKKDIQTSNFSLFPQYRYNKDSEQEQVINYRAINQVTVIVRDVRKVGDVIDLSIKAGANNVNQVIFSVDSPEKWRDKAIEKAIEDARSKAEIMARAAKITIKRVLSIAESNVNVRPLELNYLRKSGAMDAMAGPMANTPVESGNVKITVNVQMSFEI